MDAPKAHAADACRCAGRFAPSTMGQRMTSAATLGAKGVKELPSLVLELQSDVLDTRMPCSDLLRKAFVVSKKLGVEKIQEWLSHELNGYPQRAAIPDYREIRGSLKVWNPYRGWQPLYFRDARDAELLSTKKNRQPIGELESLVKTDKVDFLQIYFPPYIENQLLRGMDVPLQPSLHVSPNQVVRILDAVRNTILEWVLELEKQGVIGEGMTFSKEEKQAAGNVTYQITHNIGNMQHSQIQHDSPNASQIIRVEININAIADFLQQLRAARNALKLSDEASAELTAEIATLDSQLRSPNPKNSILSESLRSVRNILEGMTGSIIASTLLNALSSIL